MTTEQQNMKKDKGKKNYDENGYRTLAVLNVDSTLIDYATKTSPNVRVLLYIISYLIRELFPFVFMK